MKGAGLEPASPGCPVQLLPANSSCLAVTLQQEGEKVTLKPVQAWGDSSPLTSPSPVFQDKLSAVIHTPLY